MEKAKSLRAYLENAIPWIKQNPDKLIVLIPSGSISTTGTGTISFEGQFTLELIFIEYPHNADTVFIPILSWLRTGQPDLLENNHRMEEAIRFEAEFIDHSKVDISIKLKLDERVKVTESTGGITVEHMAEPQPADWLDWSSLWTN